MIELIRGDITQIDMDAIINAANKSLQGGGGVDGAIHRAAGPKLLEECRAIGGCPTGQARLTQGYQLKSRYIIHTVGPVYKDGKSGEAEQLACCYENCIRLAAQHGLRNLAFPAISCGVYGYPINDACRIAVDVVTKSLHHHPNMTVYFVCFSEEIHDTYQRLLHTL